MPELNTSPLSQFFDPLIQKLLAVTERGEGDSANKSLRSAAFEALMALLKSSPKDCYPTVQRTTLVVLEKLNHFLQLEVCSSSSNILMRCRACSVLLTTCVLCFAVAGAAGGSRALSGHGVIALCHAPRMFSDNTSILIYCFSYPNIYFL